MRARYRGRSESLGKSPSWSANASPFVGGWRLAAGGWRLAAGDWRLLGTKGIRESAGIPLLAAGDRGFLKPSRPSPVARRPSPVAK